MILFETVGDRKCSSNDSDSFKPAKAVTSQVASSAINTEQVQIDSSGRRRAYRRPQIDGGVESGRCICTTRNKMHDKYKVSMLNNVT